VQEELCYAPGTAAPNCGRGRILSCSDKIALWNVVGVQGRLLRSILAPVFFSTLTVGRKFHRKHLGRAVCCRLQELANINHPVLLCTSVKLHDGAIDADFKASFDQARTCLAWCVRDDKLDVIDGETGLPFQGSGEPFASVAHCALQERFRRIRLLLGPIADVLSEGGYAAAKSRAKEIMLSRVRPSFLPRPASKKRKAREEEQPA